MFVNGNQDTATCMCHVHVHVLYILLTIFGKDRTTSAVKQGTNFVLL